MKRWRSADQATRDWWEMRSVHSSARAQNVVEGEFREYGEECAGQRCDSKAWKPALAADGRYVARCVRCARPWPYDTRCQTKNAVDTSSRPEAYGASLVQIVDLGQLMDQLEPEDATIYALHIIRNLSYAAAADAAQGWAVEALLGRPPERPWTEKRARGAVKRCRQAIESELERRGWLDVPVVGPRRVA